MSWLRTVEVPTNIMSKVLMPTTVVLLLTVYVGSSYAITLDDFLYLIGDYSNNPVWFQEIVEKRIELYNAGIVTYAPVADEKRNFCGVVILRLRPKALSQIANVPDWFKNLQVYGDTTVQPRDRNEKIATSDYPEWFKTWHREYVERRKLFYLSGRPISSTDNEAPSTTEDVGSTSTTEDVGSTTTEDIGPRTTTEFRFFG